MKITLKNIKQKLLFFTFLGFSAGISVAGEKPNILVVMTDDMGFSDLGCYGAEINTPHLDSLAEGGLRFSNFYNTARCWPSRTSLLTGYHLEQITGGPPFLPKGKRKEVTNRITALPKLLKKDGYRSYHSGKWHIHSLPEVIKDAGFDHSLAFHTGSNHFRPRNVKKDDKLIKSKNVYDTDAMADAMIGYLQDHDKNHADAPFFSYLAFYAPHWPLHAKQKTIDKYKGVYDEGWDVLRKKRLQKMQELGFPSKWKLPELDYKIESSGIQKTAKGESIFGENEIYSAKNWDELNQEVKDFQSAKMEVHAAMIEDMDVALGRVIKQLKDMGEYENTLILFLSDNGASAEIYGSYNPKGKPVHDQEAAPGSADSHLCLGPGFASLANTPFRRYKIWVHEGGVATPLIAHWPKGIDKKLEGEITSKVGHIVDLVPTILEVSNTKDIELDPAAPKLSGQSLTSTFKKSEISDQHDNTIFFSHTGNRGLRTGEWKIVSAKIDENEWELYNMENDRSETTNLAEENPTKLSELIAVWEKLNKEYIQESKDLINPKS